MNILEKSNLFYKQAISNYFNINKLKDNTEFVQLKDAAKLITNPEKAKQFMKFCVDSFNKYIANTLSIPTLDYTALIDSKKINIDDVEKVEEFSRNIKYGLGSTITFFFFIHDLTHYAVEPTILSDIEKATLTSQDYDEEMYMNELPVLFLSDNKIAPREFEGAILRFFKKCFKKFQPNKLKQLISNNHLNKDKFIEFCRDELKTISFRNKKLEKFFKDKTRFVIQCLSYQEFELKDESAIAYEVDKLMKDNRDHLIKDQFSGKKKMPELVNDEISYKVINLYKFLTKATKRFI